MEVVYSGFAKENKQDIQQVRRQISLIINEHEFIQWPFEWIPLLEYILEKGFEIAGKYLIDDCKMENLIVLCVHFLQEIHLLLSEIESIESARLLALEKYRIVLESMSGILSLIQLNLHKRHRD